MDKHIVGRSLERIDEELGSWAVDKEIANGIRGELAVIRCEINKAPDPPVMDLLRGGAGLCLEPDKKYLIFADAALVHSEDIQRLSGPSGPDVVIVFCYPPSSGVGRLRDSFLAFDVSKPTMFFVQANAVPVLPEIPGIHFTDMITDEPLASCVLKQDSQIDAMLQRVLDICDDPLWVDGTAIAERIREEL